MHLKRLPDALWSWFQLMFTVGRNAVGLLRHNSVWESLDQFFWGLPVREDTLFKKKRKKGNVDFSLSHFSKDEDGLLELLDQAPSPKSRVESLSPDCRPRSARPWWRVEWITYDWAHETMLATGTRTLKFAFFSQDPKCISRGCKSVQESDFAREVMRPRTFWYDVRLGWGNQASVSICAKANWLFLNWHFRKLEIEIKGNKQTLICTGV